MSSNVGLELTESQMEYGVSLGHNLDVDIFDRFRSQGSFSYTDDPWASFDATSLFRNILDIIRTARPRIIFFEPRTQPPTEVSDLDWFASNPPELDEYKGSYVAIFNHEIVGWGDTVKEASQMARKKVKELGVPLIAFIEDNYEILFLVRYVCAKAINPFFNASRVAN